MSIPVQCPSCQYQFSVPDRFAGKRGKCPKCSSVFRAASNGDAPLAKADTAPVAAGSPPLPQPPQAADSSVVAPPKAGEPNPFADLENGGGGAGAPPSTMSQRAARKSSSAPLLITLSIGGVLILGGVIAWAVGSSGSKSKKSAKNDNKPAANKPAQSPSDKTPPKQDDSTGKPPAKKVPPQPKVLSQLQLNDYWDDMHPFLVQVIAKTPEGTNIGAGFVVDTRGWVATSNHLLNGASSVRVRMATSSGVGREVEALGLIVRKPEHDLAVIKLGPPGVDVLTDLKLAADAEPASGDVLIAFGNPAQTETRLAESRLNQFVLNTNMPPSSKAVLRERGMNDANELRWIHHSASIGKQDCGGPLIDRHGRVVGINVQLGSSAEGGYAIHIKHLADLIKDAPNKALPFESDEVAKNDPPDEDPFPDTKPDPFPTPDPDPEPEPDVEPASGSADAMAGAIGLLQERCRKMNWRPRNMEEYAVFQGLAKLVAEANMLSKLDELSEKQRAELAAAVKKVTDELSKVPWGRDNVLVEVNKLAIEGMKGGEPGVFAYASVNFYISGEGGVPRKLENFQDRYLGIWKLVSTTHDIAIPNATGPEVHPEGGRRLILGYRQNFGLTVNLNINGEVSTIKPLVVEAVAIPKPERAEE